MDGEVETCLLCGSWPHQEGCPAGPDATIGCGHCGGEIPLRELSEHLREHGDDVPQDELEHLYLYARDWAKAERDLPTLREMAGIDLETVLYAVARRTIRGRWDPGFEVEKALLVALEALFESYDRCDALTANLQRAAEKVAELKRENGA